MQDRTHICFFRPTVKKIVTTLSLMALLVGCDDTSSKKQEMKPAQPAVQSEVKQPIQTEPKFEYRIDELTINVPECKGQLCPDVKIYRLESNFPILDEAVDDYIYNYMSSFLQGFDLPLSPNEIIQPETPQLKTPVQEVEKSKSQDKISQNSDNSKQDPNAILVKEIQPQITKFFALADEVKSLGSSSQLNIYIKPQVLNPESPVTTVVINSNNYIGGAHGSSAQQYVNFEMDTNKILNIEHIIQTGKRKALNDVVYAKFKAWVKQTQADTQIEAYEKLWSFKLSDNFYLGPQGLVFQYGEYEIGPYVVGLPRLTVPYAELKDILKPQYIPVVENKSQTPKQEKTKS